MSSKSRKKSPQRPSPAALVEPSGIFYPSSRNAAIVVFAATLLIYLNSLGGAFVFDDTVIIQGNSSIQGLDPAHIKEIFGGHYWRTVESQGGLYRPVVMLSYALNYAVGGDNPAGYHLFNLIIHALNGILVFFLMEELFRRRPLSFLSALLFVAHPIRTEGVASIVGRAESLSAFFLLLAWWGYARNCREPRVIRTVISGLFFIIATLSKESAFCLLFLLPLTDMWLGPGTVRERFRVWRCAIRFGPWVLAAGLSLALRSLVLGGFAPLSISEFSNPLVHAGTVTRFLTSNYVFARYLFLLVFPIPLSADYSFNAIPLVTGFVSVRAVIALLAPVLAIAALIGTFRRAPYYFFCVAIFLVSFILTSNWLRPIGTIMAERLMYLPSLGFTCAVAYLLCQWLVTHRRARVGAWAAALLIVFYGLRSADRNLDWRDHFHLFESAARVCPDSYLAQSNLGAVLLFERNDPRNALTHARRALAIREGDPAARFTLGEASLRLGDRAEAMNAFAMVARLAPRTSGGARALRKLASLHETMGMKTEAIRDFELLLNWRPADAEASRALARLVVK